MAYDQHTQYQPPPRPYYNRENPRPARQEVYRYDQYFHVDTSGTTQYDQLHEGPHASHLPNAYLGQVTAYTPQQNSRREHTPAVDYHGSGVQNSHRDPDSWRVGISNSQPDQAGRGAYRGRGAQTDNLSGSAHSEPIASQARNNSRPSKDRIPLPASPQKTSWDNPFPTFPNTKHKATEGRRVNLNENAASMSPEGKSRKSNESRLERPLLGSSKGSYNSSKSQEDAQDTFPGRGYFVQQPSRIPEEHFNGSRQDSTHGFDLNLDQGSTPVHYGAAQQPYRPQQLDEQANSSSHINHKVPIPVVQRSMTMPAELASEKPSPRPLAVYPDQIFWQQPGSVDGYHGPVGTNFIPPRPATASGSRPAPGLRSRSDDASKNHFPRPPNVPLHNGPDQYQVKGSTRAYSERSSAHSKQESVGEVLDSYYDMPGDDYETIKNRPYYPAPVDHKNPHFETATTPGSTPKREMAIDQHSIPHSNGSGVPLLPSSSGRGSTPIRINQTSHVAGQTSRSTSQPDLRGHSQASSNGNSRSAFGMVGFDVPRVPPMPNYISGVTMQQPHHAGQMTGQNPEPTSNGPGVAGYSHSRSGSQGSAQRQRLPPPQQNGCAETNRSTSGHSGRHHRPVAGPVRHTSAETQRSDPGQRDFLPRGTPSPANQVVSRPSPSAGRSANPDALPAHPTPVRAGLMPDSLASEAIKPPITRQNNCGLETQSSSKSKRPVSSTTLSEKRQSLPVTHEELEGLKRLVKANPSDSKTQLLLAKKWVEAATVLADEGGRVDIRTRNKNRERFVFDAHKVVKKLVSNGYPEAMFYLADCTGRGLLGLEPDTKEAFSLYQSAAKAGHAQSAYRTAVCCEMGQEEGGGTRRDPVKAIQWYKRAATLGDTPAMYKMGMILLKGLLGQPKNSREAVTWLKRAADRADEENPHALHELGLLYETANGNDNVLRDEQYSKQLFTKAADLGYKFSQFRLGCAYEYGLMGCPIDPRQSIAWYSRAAVQEEHQSELALSGWYLTGSEGVLQQSDTEAYLWARKAAQAGLAKAEYAMGYFTEVGIGAPSNIADAQRWYQRAASQNFPKARERLVSLRNGGANSQKSREQISRSKVNKQNEGECVVM